MFLPIVMENLQSLKVVKLKNDVKVVDKMWNIAGFQCIFDGGWTLVCFTLLCKTL